MRYELILITIREELTRTNMLHWFPHTNTMICRATHLCPQYLHLMYVMQKFSRIHADFNGSTQRDAFDLFGKVVDILEDFCDDFGHLTVGHSKFYIRRRRARANSSSMHIGMLPRGPIQQPAS